jgi:hypothetical protein
MQGQKHMATTPKTRRFDASGKERFDKANNFQVGDSGRDKRTVTYTFKKKTPRGTEAQNVRCGPKNKGGKACEVVSAVYDNTKELIREERLKTDEQLKAERKRKGATKAARAKLEKAPF